MLSEMKNATTHTHIAYHCLEFGQFQREARVS